MKRHVMTETVVVMDQVFAPVFLIKRYSPPGATPLGGARWSFWLPVIMVLFMGAWCCEGALTGDAVTCTMAGLVPTTSGGGGATGAVAPAVIVTRLNFDLVLK